MRYVSLLSFVAVVHGAADVAVLAQSMDLIAQAFQNGSANKSVAFNTPEKILLDGAVDDPLFAKAFEDLEREVGEDVYIITTGDQKNKVRLREVIANYSRGDLEEFRNMLSAQKHPKDALLVDAALRLKKSEFEKRKALITSLPEAAVLPGGLLPEERDEYFAMLKNLNELKPLFHKHMVNLTEKSYINGVYQGVKKLQISWVDWIASKSLTDLRIALNKNNTDSFDDEETKFVQAVIKAKEFMLKDRGFRILPILFYTRAEDDQASHASFCAQLRDVLPMLCRVEALQNFTQFYQRSHNSEDFSPEVRKIIGNTNTVSADFYKRCVRYNSQYGWFLILPVAPQENGMAVAQKLGLVLDASWISVTSLEHAKSLAEKKKDLPSSCALVMKQLLLPNYRWFLLLDAHGSSDRTVTCEMSLPKFREVLENLAISQVPIAKVVVNTCFGGSKEILQQVYRKEKFPFEIIFPSFTEVQLVVDGALSLHELFFFLENPSFPLVSNAVANGHTAMLIRHKNADHFELFDPWNKRAQEPGLRPDIKGTYAPAVPWRRGMKPEEIHPAARATA